MPFLLSKCMHCFPPLLRCLRYSSVYLYCCFGWAQSSSLFMMHAMHSFPSFFPLKSCLFHYAFVVLDVGDNIRWDGFKGGSPCDKCYHSLSFSLPRMSPTPSQHKTSAALERFSLTFSNKNRYKLYNS